MIKVRIAFKIAMVLAKLYIKHKYGGKGIGIGNFKYAIGEKSVEDRSKLNDLRKIVGRLIK